jgi:hypothetical protein
MKVYANEERHKILQRWVLTRLAVPALMFGAIILCLVLALKSVVLAADPLVLNYRTISVVDSSTQPGTTIITLEFEITNTDTLAYNNVSVVASSITYGTSYGSIAVGELTAGESQTVTGQLSVPAESIGDITYRINHS